jgi:hypothetical protein
MMTLFIVAPDDFCEWRFYEKGIRWTHGVHDEGISKSDNFHLEFQPSTPDEPMVLEAVSYEATSDEWHQRRIQRLCNMEEAPNESTPIKRGASSNGSKKKFSHWTNDAMDALGYLYPLHPIIWGCWIVWKRKKVEDTLKIVVSKPQKCPSIHPKTLHISCRGLRGSINLELWRMKGVPTMWGDSRLNQDVQGVPEPCGIIGSLATSSTRRRGVVWRRSFVVGGIETTSFGGTRSLLEVASRWPRELGECLHGEPLWQVK